MNVMTSNARSVLAVMVGIHIAAMSMLAAAAPQSAGAAKPAAAQQPTADQGAEMTTASFGDWLLRCRQAAAGQTHRSCEVVQSIVVQGQSAPIAQLGFGRLSATEPLFFTAVLPPNVTFPSTVRVTIDDKDTQPVDVVWTRCLPGGCYASLLLKDDVLARWRAQNDAGRLTFKNGSGQDTVLPFSFRGLARALDALAKEG
jgi:invasion protein IalB